MRRSTKWLVRILGIVAWVLILGFVIFANQVTRTADPQPALADGIVVFTGEGIRIKEAARLLNDGHADKLLISGVNRKIHANQLRRVTGLTKEQFDCCVTLGYEALNTVGNANETLAWARAHDLKTLIVVTASYHMPRAMAELTLAMPGRKLHAHSVLPARFRGRAWWLHVDDTVVLASEYLKFLPAAVRAGVHRVQHAWTKPTGAVTSATSN